MTKTTAAKARVDGLREALRREQADSGGLKKVGTGRKQVKKAPTANGTISKSKGNPQSRGSSPFSTGATEPAVNDAVVSV